MSQSERRPEPPFPKQPISPPGLEQKMSPRPRYSLPDYVGAGKLKDKVALITGGDSGIGRSVAVLFAREGASSALVYLPEEQRDAEETQQNVEDEGVNCCLIPGDVSDPKFCMKAVDKCIDKLGSIDILVNNAAYQQHQEGLDEISLEQWDKTFRTNIYGYFYMARAAAPKMEKGSVILNTGSVTGLEGSKELLDYSATKGAIHAFTKSLAQNLFSRGIRVNCVAPGPVWTPLNPAEREHEDMKDFGSQIPAGRPAQPEEIAPAYVFLASSLDSGFISGEIITILGGQTHFA